MTQTVTMSQFLRHRIHRCGDLNLDRLLAFNHQRYEEEVKTGLHGKGAKKCKAKKAMSTGAVAPQADLI